MSFRKCIGMLAFTHMNEDVLLNHIHEYTYKQLLYIANLLLKYAHAHTHVPQKGACDHAQINHAGLEGY